MECKIALFEEIVCHKGKILAVVQIPNLEDRCQAFAERTLSIKNELEAARKQLPILKRYFIHRETSKGFVDWLTEINSLLQDSFSVDSIESAEHEFEANYSTRTALQDNKQAIEETVINAKTLEEAGTLSEMDIKSCDLEELWNSVQELVSKRTQELEECVGIWTSYEEDMLHVMSCLTKGEMVLAEVKSNQGHTKDVLQQFLEQIEVAI